MESSNGALFEEAGSKTDQIDVKISHRIIQLFSEGLYSSPNKAIEELVSNSFDAGAENVHILLSPDLHDSSATIVVIDDGEGMNNEGLKKHWIIGASNRRKDASSKRKPIGKFGIGKLSTYVLASKLTHISKSGETYYAATMDYSGMESNAEDNSKGVFNEQTIEIPLRTLTERQAQEVVQRWVTGEREGYQALKLFGGDASKSWTVAIMSNLKDMGKKVKIGRLKWVLRTAMPQRSDFHLFLDGEPITPPETDESLEKLVIGKDVVHMSKPCPEELIKREDSDEPEDSVHRYGLYDDDGLLGRITGYIEIFEKEIDRGKDKFGQSNGFFVYVRGRQVNVDDLGFGIERNLLQHGTFSRFRMVVHVDSLDDALRSSRESFRQGDLYEGVQNFLRAGFNLARNRLVEHDRKQTPAARISASISSAPGSMTRKPLLSLAHMIAENKVVPFYLRFPSHLSAEEQAEFLETLKQQSEGALLRSTELSVLDSREGLAVFDIHQGTLLINSSHPFVAAFQEYFTDPRKNLPLEMLAMSEILMEAHLYHMGVDESVIRDTIGRRDELLRQFVRSSARRTAGMIALALTEARDDKNELEEEMRAAFEAMGFANVIRIGGKGEPDGTAEAHLAAAEDGTVQRYKVGLEAKSGGRVTAKRLGVSGIGRHMEKHNCDHHLVIGNSFSTSTGEDSASVQEIKTYREDNRKKDSEKTITLMHIDDLARLIRIVSTKRVGGLSRLRTLFRNCITPEECKEWVDGLESETPENWPYREILETIWERAEKHPDTAIEYSAVMTALEFRNPPIDISKKDLIDCCRSMQVMARGVVFARDNTVEIDRRPDLILEDIKAALGEYPAEERKPIRI